MRSGLRQSFPLFAAGALLYAAGISLCPRLVPDDLAASWAVITPLFGLPFLILRGRPGWALALYLLLLLPAIHYAAILATLNATNLPGEIGLVPGALGGLTGAVLSLAALVILRLAKPRRIGTMAAGVVTLALLGGVGVWRPSVLSDCDLVLSLYLPWQLVFGFLLARLLRAPGGKSRGASRRLPAGAADGIGAASPAGAAPR